MNFSNRIELLSKLGAHLMQEDEYLDAVIQRTKYNNPWFTVENQQRAIQAIATSFLQADKLQQWVAGSNMTEPKTPKRVGLVMAGNIPLVGFHDLLCVFISGHKSVIKLSDKDKYLLPYLLKILSKLDAASEPYFEVVERFTDFDAVIATGSNNSSRYFESYFGKVPNIIRKNRNAVAILDGQETAEDLLALGKDVFRYFGLGCRNVSKLYLPEGYDFQLLLEKLHEFKEIILHHKYKHNFDYNMALLMMNRTTFWNNGCIILAENESIASRIALLHFEYYADRASLEKNLQSKKEEIQCVVANQPVGAIPVVAFGKAQEPGLSDYADGVDTLQFLAGLK